MHVRRHTNVQESRRVPCIRSIRCSFQVDYVLSTYSLAKRALDADDDGPARSQGMKGKLLSPYNVPHANIKITDIRYSVLLACMHPGVLK